IRADIYSLGCTFYFLLTGQPPFAGGSLAQKVAKHLQTEPVPVEKARPDVPPGVAAIVAKMLAKQAEKRYLTPGEVAEALTSFVGMEAVMDQRRPPGRVWRRLLWAGMGTALLLIVGFLATFFRSSPVASWDDLQRERIPLQE